MARQSEHTTGRVHEAARLEALARVAGAAAPTSDVDAALTAIADGVHEAFGLEAVVNLLDPQTGRVTVRAATSGPAELLGTTSHVDAWEDLLVDRYEIAPDVFFIPHDAGITDDDLGPSHTP